MSGPKGLAVLLVVVKRDDWDSSSTEFTLIRLFSAV